jgi:hypothetical protein
MDSFRIFKRLGAKERRSGSSQTNHTLTRQSLCLRCCSAAAAPLWPSLPGQRNTTLRMRILIIQGEGEFQGAVKRPFLHLTVHRPSSIIRHPHHPHHPAPVIQPARLPANKYRSTVLYRTRPYCLIYRTRGSGLGLTAFRPVSQPSLANEMPRMALAHNNKL